MNINENSNCSAICGAIKHEPGDGTSYMVLVIGIPHEGMSKAIGCGETGLMICVYSPGSSGNKTWFPIPADLLENDGLHPDYISIKTGYNDYTALRILEAARLATNLPKESRFHKKYIEARKDYPVFRNHYSEYFEERQ